MRRLPDNTFTRGLAFLLVCGSATAAAPDLANIPIHTDDATHSLFFYDSGWFSDARYPIRYFDAKWHWQTQGSWVELTTPFIGKWNDHFRIILDRGGKVFLNSIDGRNQMEIGWRSGEWEWRNTDSSEWSSIQADSLEDEYDRRGG